MSEELVVAVPRTRTETAKQALCVAAPNVWNSLPNDIRYVSSLSSFSAKLKTHFFTVTYSWWHTHRIAYVLTFS